MPRGRIPAPKKINALKGDSHKRRRHEIEPEAPLGWPECPEHIRKDPIASSEWKSICTQLESMQLLATTDRPLLEVYALTYSRWRSSLLSDDPNAFTQERRYASDMKSILIEFGLSPASRARCRIAGNNKQTPESKWATVLKFGT